MKKPTARKGIINFGGSPRMGGPPMPPGPNVKSPAARKKPGGCGCGG